MNKKFFIIFLLFVLIISKLMKLKSKKISKSVTHSTELQLMLAVKEGSVSSIVNLYANGASADAVDINGNNILHLAVKSGSIKLIQTILLLYGTDSNLFTKENKDGKRPEELTYSNEIKKCIEIIETGKILSINNNNNPTSFEKDVRIKMNRQNIEKRFESGERLSILLSLDGGGIRGLVLIRILMHLERKLGSSFWEKIDWVAGTSTGGILALALAKKRPLEEMQKLYLRLKNDVFVGSRPYNSEILERFLRTELGDDSMKTLERPKVVITTCLTHVAPPQLKLFRNYFLEETEFNARQKENFGYDDPDYVAIWKAARCSSAAPTYFTPYEEIYSDGGIMANNPTLELITEFYRYKTITQCYGEASKDSIGCVISLGTGMSPIQKIALRETKVGHIIKSISKYGNHLKNMVTIFIKQLTASDGCLVDTSQAWCTSINVPFYRFSPPLNKNVELDERRDQILIDMLWETEFYMTVNCSEEVDDLMSFIKKLTS